MLAVSEYLMRKHWRYEWPQCSTSLEKLTATIFTIYVIVCVFFLAFFFSRTLTSTWRRSIKHVLFLPGGINTNYTEAKANISHLWGQPWVTDTVSSHNEWHVEKQVSESSLHSITSLNETSWLLQQTAQIMRVILMPLTTIYHAVLNVFLICFH